jgi:hypothetical protein
LIIQIKIAGNGNYFIFQTKNINHQPETVLLHPENQVSAIKIYAIVPGKRGLFSLVSYKLLDSLKQKF